MPLLVPTHIVSEGSSYKLMIELLPMPDESGLLFLKTRDEYPSNLYNPFLPPNHMKPFLSCVMQVMLLLATPLLPW
jgi:hypothetical protein